MCISFIEKHSHEQQHNILINDYLQALKDGDELMNVGKLKYALPYYEKVMDKMMFQVILLVRRLGLILYTEK